MVSTSDQSYNAELTYSQKLIGTDEVATVTRADWAVCRGFFGWCGPALAFCEPRLRSDREYPTHNSVHLTHGFWRKNGARQTTTRNGGNGM